MVLESLRLLKCAVASYVVAISLLAQPAAAQPQGENPFLRYEHMWSFTAGSGAVFHFERRDFNRAGYFGKPTVWVRGNFKDDPSVAYRSTLTLYVLDCDGQFAVKAHSVYSADGSNESEWDTSFVSWKAIRPDTLTASLEAAVCDLADV